MATSASVPGSPAPAVDLSKPDIFINRELSWLEFNQRVLDQALGDDHPLLERVKFLAIVGSNLDEFFMVRVATLLKKLRAGVDDASIDGLSVAARLAAVREARHDDDARPGGLLARPAAAGCSPNAASSFSSRPTTRKKCARHLKRLLQRGNLSAADAAGVRSRPSVSVHFKSKQELRGGRAPQSPHEIRARQSARHASTLRAAYPVQARAGLRRLRFSKTSSA